MPLCFACRRPYSEHRDEPHPLYTPRTMCVGLKRNFRPAIESKPAGASIVPTVSLIGPDGVTPIPCGVPGCFVCHGRFAQRRAS